QAFYLSSQSFGKVGSAVLVRLEDADTGVIEKHPGVKRNCPLLGATQRGSNRPAPADRHPSSVSSRNYFVGVGGRALQRKCRLTRRIGIPRRLVVTLPLSELCKSPIPRGQQPAPSCPEAASSAKPRTFDRWLLQCKRLLAPPGTNVAPVARY